ncbi:MAG: sulfatase-like hydrolase/transferase [Anaerolineae bacterium]
MPQPNILLIQADQHRYDCLGAAGHPLVRTPHLDGLAAEGVLFTHAFCPSPVSVPSRSSLLFGCWPVRHGRIVNWGNEAAPPRRELPAFSQTLRAAGYRLGYVGYWHVDPDRGPEDFGFHEYVPEAGYTAWRAQQSLPPVPDRAGWLGEVDPHISPEQSRTAWSAGEAIRLLEMYATGQQPFFLRWDPTAPHLPNRIPEPYASLYPPDGIAPWPSFPDELQGKPFIQAQQRRTWGVEGWGWERWAPIVARYLGEITLLDEQVGRLLAALERLGLAENTMVVYTSDHGDLCGAHGMLDKHYVMYEDVVRVPLLVRWPGRAQAGLRSQAFVCHALDLAATFCAAAGVEPPTSFQGQSLLPVLAGAEGTERDSIFATYHGSQFGLYSQRMVRDQRWKYVWNATAEDELYDLQADPGERDNRARDPACEDELAQLRARLIGWMEETKDPLLNDWTRAQLLEGRKP